MAPEKRDGAGGLARPTRIPVPPGLAPIEKGQQPAPVKSGIPSPRRRSASGGGSGTNSRGKDGTSSAILSAPNNANTNAKRTLPTAATSKFSKPLSRPNSSQSCDDKDDVRQRDNGQKDGARRDSFLRDKAVKDSVPRRPAPAAESTNLTDAGKRLLLKSGAAACPVASPSGKAAPAAAAAASSKAPPRSVSTCRDRASNETRTSMMRRSMSVGKGRILANQPEPQPQQAGAKMRPSAARVGSASSTGAPYRQSADKRDASAARLRPLSAASGKSDVSLAASCKSTLTTITEAPARPTAHATASTSAAQPQKPAVPSRPVFSLNLAALKSQAAPPPAPAAAPPPTAPVPALPPVEPCMSPTPEDAGPPVPKLDLKCILQRRAEEQASEPVFVVAADEDVAQPSGSSSHTTQLDKRKSGSRQPSAKEEPAEHFYLYPKVNPQEKKRIEDICRVMPKRQQAAITDLFGKMVEARQNCEQMCFRGHRLLDQAQTEFKSRLAQKEEEVAQKSEEAAQWRQEAEFLRSQLAMLLGSARQQEDCPEDASAPPTQTQPEGSEEERAAYLRSSLLSTFDSLAQLGAVAAAYGGDGQGAAQSGEAAAEAYGGDGQGDEDG
ncbi:hypothetical protein PLESTB_001252300 [Pleodorina starrii]|uniref:Uncharacterized protein n=1 Tax=Pleodorina starrii TaxID=330485 RepID=A0A9W6F633_9CHLO|nr:hypothetical protein PLESTM_000207600 [Pleodorina starrii]GLC57673.1 hypothetical protein PLESTB_001252300 [Pleodorina starrii]GLC63342.1 hypothetical protein PLESTF_000026100 [Pleodorina starrii]